MHFYGDGFKWISQGPHTSRSTAVHIILALMLAQSVGTCAALTSALPARRLSGASVALDALRDEVAGSAMQTQEVLISQGLRTEATGVALQYDHNTI